MTTDAKTFVNRHLGCLKQTFQSDLFFSRLCDMFGFAHRFGELRHDRHSRVQDLFNEFFAKHHGISIDNFISYFTDDFRGVRESLIELAEQDRRSSVLASTMPFKESRVLSSSSAPNSSAASAIASAFLKVQSKKELTVREFFNSTDGTNAVAANKLVLALDESGLWELILSDGNMLEDAEVAALVVQWKQEWATDLISPTKKMLAELFKTPFGDQPMKEFANYLKTKQNTEIVSIIDSWVSKIEGKMLSNQKAGIRRFESAKTLHEFFMDLVDDDMVFTPEIIPGIVAKLQSDCITSAKLLGKLKDEQLEKYGLKMGQIMVLREALTPA